MTLRKEIQEWEGGRNWFQFRALNTHLNRTNNQQIPAEAIQRELKWLEEAGLLERKQEQYRLCEYDPPEETLYDKLEVHFGSKEFFDKQLGMKEETFVLQNTSKGGALGEGRLTRPDFTLAAVRRWRFDPSVTLDVFSFEVKNRAGSSVAAVYEALAHGRYVNYPYLVCPSSRFDEGLNSALKSSCERAGVGLIQFDIHSSHQKNYGVGNLSRRVPSERRATDPAETEKFLNSRFNEENKQRLERLARAL